MPLLPSSANSHVIDDRGRSGVVTMKSFRLSITCVAWPTCTCSDGRSGMIWKAPPESPPPACIVTSIVSCDDSPSVSVTRKTTVSVPKFAFGDAEKVTMWVRGSMKMLRLFSSKVG